VVGFNHNVKYGPRVYHVQTEDSGLPHAHYITHLFVGGNIVASMKTSYAERMSEPNLPAAVRSLMEGQHKHMLKRLVAGEFNEMAERLSATHYDPGVLADGSNQASYVNTGPSAPGPATAAARPAARAAPPAAKPRAPAAPPAAKPLAPAAAPKPAVPAARPAAKPAPLQPVWQAAPPSASPAAAPRTPGQPLPNVTRAPAQTSRPAAPPRMVPVVPPTPAPPRPAPARAKPAPALFSETPVEAPHDDLPTLFAEELISEKSLDEVILAFLSADLEPPK
jgi:hypothetical protein